MLYTAEELNLSQEELQSRLDDAKIVSSKKYLSDTDWYYARKAENGDLVPEEVVAKRVEAREFIRTNEALEVK